MRTYLECVPCFFKQALDASVLAGADKKTQKKILRKLAQKVLSFDTRQCPTAMGMVLYRLVRKTTGNNDPFKEIKKKSNALALALYPRLKEKVQKAKDPLLAAIELAIAGNIIDYGTKHP
ncbi:MAG: ARMT1-like domain-containing protein, partial [Candidatus Omnitrophota bacterium]